MSIPNDLEIASTFALQDIPPQPVVTAAAAATAAPVEKTESMEVDNTNTEKPVITTTATEPDIIDAAISGIKKEEGYESSDLELSSDSEEEEEDSSDSSEDSSSSSEDEDEPAHQKTTNEALDDDEEVFPDGIVKTAHEIVDIIVEKPNFELTPQTEIILAGTIFQIIDNVVVIHCRPACEYSTLDQGSLLVYENREIMGEVFETFGPVARPYYSVRFNDAKEINMEFGKLGASVYYVPTYQKTQIVETEALKKLKGTDASNVYDEEVGEEEMEFSDDEKEMEFKRKRNREKKMKKNGGAALQMEDGRPAGPNQRRSRLPRNLPEDFDSALAAYEGSQMPPRQQQSYADLMDNTPQPNYYHPTPQQAQQSNYQSPADLVSALFKSYNGQLPTQLPASSTPQTQQTQPQQPQQPQSQESQSETQPQPMKKAAIRALFLAPPPTED